MDQYLIILQFSNEMALAALFPQPSNFEGLIIPREQLINEYKSPSGIMQVFDNKIPVYSFLLNLKNF